MSSERESIRRNFAQHGRLEWIGIRSAPNEAMVALAEVDVHPLVGLIGDHGRKAPPRLRANAPAPAIVATTNENGEGREGRPRGMRQVTLLQYEHLAAMSSILGRNVAPEQLRRNLCVSGLPILALVGQRFWVGEVLLEGTGPCHPCEKMEKNLGKGGYNVVMGHGGITARVIQGGRLRLGDVVFPARENA